MKGSAIRILASAYESPLLAAGHFDQTVQIWNIRDQQKLAEFKTPLEFGGKRLAISTTGDIVVAGSYGAAGIAAFASSTGALLWQRKEFRQLQRLNIGPGNTVACGFERGSLQILDTVTGRTVDTVRGGRDRHSSPFDGNYLLEKKHLELHSPARSKPIKIARETFAVLSACFSPDAVAITEAGGPVRCFDLHSGELRWRYNPPESAHFLEVGFNESARTFILVQRQLDRSPISPVLTLAERTGALLNKYAADASAEYAFMLNGSRLVSSCGWILDTSTHKLAGSLEFPVKDYNSCY